MNAIGKVVSDDVPAVYTERYGEPEEKKGDKRLTWLSDRGIALVWYDDLYLISKQAYEELSTYIKNLEAEEDAKRREEEKARRDNI